MGNVLIWDHYFSYLLRHTSCVNLVKSLSLCLHFPTAGQRHSPCPLRGHCAKECCLSLLWVLYEQQLWPKAGVLSKWAFWVGYEEAKMELLSDVTDETVSILTLSLIYLPQHGFLSSVAPLAGGIYSASLPYYLVFLHGPVTLIFSAAVVGKNKWKDRATNQGAIASVAFDELFAAEREFSQWLACTCIFPWHLLQEVQSPKSCNCCVSENLTWSRVGLPSLDSHSEFADTQVGLGAQLSTCTALVFQGYPENGIASTIVPHECISKGRLWSFSARETHSPRSPDALSGAHRRLQFLKQVLYWWCVLMCSAGVWDRLRLPFRYQRSSTTCFFKQHLYGQEHGLAV